MAGVAQWVLDSAGVDDSGPTPMAALCAKRLGSPPRWISGLPMEAKLEGKVVLLRAGVPATRARWLVGHELAHDALNEVGYREPDVEDVADAVGAALVAPSRAVRLAIAAAGGHRVYAIADAFATTQSLALLRIGEVTGRPVLLTRKGAPIARGGAFVWGSERKISEAVRGLVREVHPLRIRDEPHKVGLMAREW